MESKDHVEDHEINLLELLHVLVKRKMFIIKVCCVAVAFSVAYSLTLPNKYSATAKLLPPQKEGGGGLSSLLGQAGNLAALAGGGLGGSSDLYVGILKSRSIADSVVARLDLMKVYEAQDLEMARRELDSAVKVQAGKDGIISVTAEDEEPKRAADLANTFVQELTRTTVRLNLSKAGTERLFLEQRLEIVKKDLLAAEEELKSFSQRNKIVQVDSQAKASIEGVARLKAELASKEVLLAVLRSQQTDQSPEVKAIQSGIRKLKGEIGILAGTGSGGEGIPAIGSVPGVGLEYARKVRELKTQEAIFNQLTQQYEMAKLSEAKDSSSFQVLDDAVVPIYKSEPRRSLIVILSLAAAFIGSIFVIFIQEYFARVCDDDRHIIGEIKKHLLVFK